MPLAVKESQTSALTDIFIKIASVDGETKDPAKKGSIDVLSWNWGMGQGSAQGTGSGMGAGVVGVNNLNFTHVMDSASPRLMQLCSGGTHVSDAELIMRLPGGKQLDYLKIKLERVYVADVKVEAGGPDKPLGNKPTEMVSLRFNKVKVDFHPQKGEGALDAAKSFTWNIEQRQE